jgi:hypothetical protein
VQERKGDLAKVIESFERTKALKGKAQECRQVKETVRDSLAEYAGWVTKPRVRHLLVGRQPPRRMLRMSKRKKGPLILETLKGEGA